MGLCLHGLGGVPGKDVDVPAYQRLDGLTAPSKDTEAHVAGSLPAWRTSSAAFIQSWLPSVPPAPNTIRWLLSRSALHQLRERLKGALRVYSHHAVVSAQRGHPAHCVHRMRAKTALGNVQQRAAGEGHQSVVRIQPTRGRRSKATAPMPPGR